MPIRNITSGTVLPQRVFVADTMLGRMTGLLGTDAPDPANVAFFSPCSGIHTFGMRYPLDVVFLDHENRIIRHCKHVFPNRMTGLVHGAHTALEFPAGTVNGILSPGDRLDVTADGRLAGDMNGLRRLFHWPVNCILALLWGNLIFPSYNQFAWGGGVTSLGLAIVNTLVAFLFLTRRESREISRRFPNWLIPGTVVFLLLALGASPVLAHPFSAIPLTLQGIGILVMIGSLLSMGRSFGVIPANRGIRYAGAYRIVRHPLYVGELTFAFGFLAGNFTLFTGVAVLAILIADLWRMAAEEKLLIDDREYREYATRVRFRMIPGIY